VTTWRKRLGQEKAFLAIKEDAVKRATNKPGRKFVSLGWTTLLIIGFVIGFLKVAVLADVRSQGYPGSFAKLADKSSVSVVNIIAVKVIREAPQGTAPFGWQDPMRDFFERFFGQQMPQEYRQNELGTGFIIDTDASINPGNSGGPAERAGIKRGDVILQFDGTAILNSHDLSFVVASTPIEKTVGVDVMRDSQRINLQVKTEEFRGEFEEAPPGEVRPYLGMQVQEITPELAKNYDLSRSSGIIVVEVADGSMAAEAGLISGDIIVEIEKQPVANLEIFSRLLTGFKEGHIILFLINRDGTMIYVTLTVEK
jgi:S1-C subfamily serine protease